MKSWYRQYGLVFFLGLAALSFALAFSMIATGALFDQHPWVFALRAFGAGFMAASMAMFTAMRRKEAGSTGLDSLFGFLIIAGLALLVLGIIFPQSTVSRPASLGGLGFAAAALVIAALAQIFSPATPEPLAKVWPATTVLTKFAVPDDDHHDDHAHDHASADESAQDDLTRIEGIGPKIQSILYEAGIQTYAGLAGSEPENLREIIKGAGFKAPFNPDSWPSQAEMAAEGDWDQLGAYQKGLVAGRA